MKPFITFLLLLMTIVAPAQTDEVRKGNFNTRKSLALEGYDPVTYFDGEPKEGDSDFEFVYRGVMYRFVSTANMNRFKAAPANFEPAYGGWCAFAMGDSGEKVKVDPETFKIIEGRLYLFYNFWGNNTLTTWNKNEKVLKNRGDANWKKFVP